MNATAIRDFLRSVKEAGADIKQLKAEDAALIESYLSRIKAEANARGLANLEQSADERLLALKGVHGAGNVFKTITTDVATALNNRISHIRKIVFEAKSNGTYKFSGCHSKSAIDELGANARIEVTIPANAEV